MSISAGRLKHPVIIERTPDPPQLDSEGQEIENWQFFKNDRVRIEPLRGREFFAAREVNSEVTHKITGRWDTKFDIINSKYRIRKLDGRVFDIDTIMNLFEADTTAQMMAIERSAQNG